MRQAQPRPKPELDWTEGVFLIDKPAGLTSFAVVRRVRWLLGLKKVGHAGTLDPFATGLMILCAGRTATRCLQRFMEGKKTYLARLQLGVETTTQDPEGEVVRTRAVPELTEAVIKACLQTMVGPQMQAPPPFSAAKHKGKPLYAYARKGIIIEKAAKPIEIYALRFHGYDRLCQQLDIEVCCSRGTYVRVLAQDIGNALGCGAYLISLRRTMSGPFQVEAGLSGEELFTEKGLALLCAQRKSIAEILPLLGETVDSACLGVEASGIEG